MKGVDAGTQTFASEVLRRGLSVSKADRIKCFLPVILSRMKNMET